MDNRAFEFSAVAGFGVGVVRHLRGAGICIVGGLVRCGFVFL